MRAWTCLLVGICAGALFGCDRGEPERTAEPEPAADADADEPAQAAGAEVTVTSNIEGAEAWQGQTKLGPLPHQLLVEGSTSLTVRATGHTSKDVELLASGASEVHVRLFPGIEPPTFTGSGFRPSGESQAPPDPVEQPDPNPPPEPIVNEPAVEPEADAEPDGEDGADGGKKGQYTTFKQVNDAYANGEITKARKKKEISRLKFERLKEIEELKKRDLDEIEYGQELRQINIRYKG